MALGKNSQTEVEQSPGVDCPRRLDGGDIIKTFKKKVLEHLSGMVQASWSWLGTGGWIRVGSCPSLPHTAVIFLWEPHTCITITHWSSTRLSSHVQQSEYSRLRWPGLGLVFPKAAKVFSVTPGPTSLHTLGNSQLAFSWPHQPGSSVSPAAAFTGFCSISSQPMSFYLKLAKPVINPSNTTQHLGMAVTQ